MADLTVSVSDQDLKTLDALIVDKDFFGDDVDRFISLIFSIGLSVYIMCEG